MKRATEHDPGQVLVVGFAGPEVPEEVTGPLSAGEWGGIILFARNIESAAQVHRMLAELPWPSGAPPLVAVDQEGGRVARLRETVVQLPPMRALARSLEPAAIRRVAEVLGGQLAALGFTMDFAPVLDVDTNPANPVIGDRSFGSTAAEVVATALPFAEGLRAGGVLPCGKHFPGHGDTHLDSHLDLPRLDHERARLDQVELAPFRAAVGAGMQALMSAHVLFESLDAEVPATLSKKVMTELLRRELGFEGVIVSDDLEMRAVRDRWGVAESAVRAIEAGCDVLLVCSDLDAAFEARRALGDRAATDRAFAARLDDAARRALALRRSRPPRPAPRFDPALFALPDDVGAMLEILR